MAQGAGESPGPSMSMPGFVVSSDVSALKDYLGDGPFVDEPVVYPRPQRS